MSSGQRGRYVPPHLRGRGDGNSGGGTTSKPGGGGSGSRWKNAQNGPDGGGGSRNGNDRAVRYGGRNNNNNDGGFSSGSGYNRTGTGSGGASRWANVDRSAISTGNHRGNSKNNNNNNNNNGRWNENRHHNHNRHHHRRYNNNNNKDQLSSSSRARAVFFGDSFIKLFGLLNDYSDSIATTPAAAATPRRRPIEVQKYKAASAKGLTREGNENRDSILRTVAAVRRRGDPASGSAPIRPYRDLERLVFCFGSVDVHLSYYYKKYVEEKPLSDDDLRAIATGYVDFVADLDTTTTTTTMDAAAAGEEEEEGRRRRRRPLDKLIVGIYPSPLRDEDVGASLLAYGSLETEDQVRAVNAAEDRTIESRQARVDLFNRALRDRCEQRNRDGTIDDDDDDDRRRGGRLEYWDVRDELLKRGDDDGRMMIKDDYKDVSDLNIHLIHETTLQLWVRKWPWYEALTAAAAAGDGDGDGGAGFLEYLQTTFDEYRKTKPWAERTHVAETRGIRLSL